MSAPTLVYDDDCGFCTWWADALADRSDLRLVGFSDLPASLCDRLPADYESCSHVVTDDAVYSCGASIEEAFVRTDVGRHLRPVVEFLRGLDVYAAVRERGYRRVATHRDLLGRVVSKTPPARSSGQR